MVKRPTDDELETMAVRLESHSIIEIRNKAAAMLRACKGRAVPNWEGFGRDLLESWPVRDVDGSELFDAALRNGLIREVPGGYDPGQHIDAEGICPEAGDPWYEYAFGAALEPAPDQGEWDAAIEAAVAIATDWTLGPEEIAPALRALKKGPDHE